MPDRPPRLIFDVPEGGAGVRLDLVLADSLGSRSQAQREIDAGRVTVDGVRRPKRHRLLGGERIVVAAPPTAAADRPVAASYAVVYEDRDLMVVAKPAGVVVHPAPGHREGTLAQALADRAVGGDDPARAGIVHRLDRDTSGLLVVATSLPAYGRLKAMIERRAITREYLALVEGVPPSRSGTIDAPIGRDLRVRTRMSTVTDDPREAVTHFALEQVYDRCSLLRVRLETGRTHQIRVHLEAIGHPVVGDPEYGRGARFGLRRQFLHAARLAFDHPITGAAVDLSAPLPADLAAVIDRLAAGRPDGDDGDPDRSPPGR